MQPLLRLSGWIDALNERVGKLAMWLVLAASLISAGNATIRYAFSTSSNAWLEIQWYLYGAMFMLAAGYTLKYDEHVRVDILYSRLSERGQCWVDLLGTLLFLLPACIIIGWMSWPLFFESIRGCITDGMSCERSGNAGGLVRWPIKLFLPLGFLLLTLQGISELIKRIAVLTGHMHMDHVYQRPVQ